MSWINAFELMCYIIVVVMLVDLVRKKDYDALFTFGAAALVGFFMELAAVAVTDIYYYNDSFWLSLGSVPKQFPLFGGFMWGGLTVYGIRIAQKLKFGSIMTALSAGFFIVTMDILLDVVAIRLDGGFWVWVGNLINTEITQHTFLSVIWVNFLGYMIETPAVVLLTQLKCKKVKPMEWGKQILGMFLIAAGAIVVTAIGSLASLGMNAITDDWFACIAFSVLWLIVALLILRRVIKYKLRPVSLKMWDYPMLIFWMAMYGYCIAAIAYLGLTFEVPWFLVLGILFTLATVYMVICNDDAKPKYAIDKELLRCAFKLPKIPKFIVPFLQKMLRTYGKSILKDNRLEVQQFTLKNGVKMVMLKPKGSNTKKVFYDIHGGGFVFPHAPYHINLAKKYALLLDANVFLIDYRLAPKYPYPAALDDCFMGYEFLRENAEKLNIDVQNIVIGGDSAGAYLAITTSLKIYEKYGITPKGNLLIYPACDTDRNSQSMKKYTDTPLCNSRDAKMYDAWFFGGKTITIMDNDLSVMPKTYLEVAEFDCLRDGGIHYTEVIRGFGISVELHDVGGTMHGFDMAQKAKITKKCVDSRIRFIGKCFDEN